MTQQLSSVSWLDQFALHTAAPIQTEVEMPTGPTEELNPFRQAYAAAHMLARIAEDRVGLDRTTSDKVGSARHESLVLGELVRQLHDEVTEHSMRVESARATMLDPTERARSMMTGLSAVVRTTTTLVDLCHTLLQIGERLLVVRDLKHRVELASAVETLRAAVSTAQITLQTSLTRITDARIYDHVEQGLPTFDLIRGYADRIAAALRNGTAPHGDLRGPMPSQRSS